MFNRRLFRPILLLIISLLVGCASTSKPTIVKASVETKAMVNPDVKGRASPIVVKVYALKSLSAFNNADFFSLMDKDKETLGAEFLDKEELQLMPGQKRELQKQFPSETRYIGVIAAFRDLERSQWRTSTEIKEQKKSSTEITLEGNKVSISQPKTSFF